MFNHVFSELSEGDAGMRFNHPFVIKKRGCISFRHTPMNRNTVLTEVTFLLQTLEINVKAKLHLEGTDVGTGNQRPCKL